MAIAESAVESTNLPNNPAANPAGGPFEAAAFDGLARRRVLRGVGLVGLSALALTAGGCGMWGDDDDDDDDSGSSKRRKSKNSKTKKR